MVAGVARRVRLGAAEVLMYVHIPAPKGIIKAWTQGVQLEEKAAASLAAQAEE